MKTINIYLDIHESFIHKAEYVFVTFCRQYNLDYKFHYISCDSIDVYYGASHGEYPVSIYHCPDAPLFFRGSDIYQIEDVDFTEFYGIRIPFLFSKNATKSSINKDIISSAFYFLSCWQEIHSPAPSKDKYSRYEYINSLQYKGGFTEIPIVDYYFKILADSLGISPKNKFSLYLSHDVDYYNYWSKDYLNQMYKKNFKRIIKHPLKSLYKIFGYFFTQKSTHNPSKKIEFLIKQENELGFNSTFNLMSKGCSDDPRQDYLRDNSNVQELLKLLENNWVGLHGTISASADEHELIKQWNLLTDRGFKPASYRNHYLCFDYNKSYTILEKLGIKIDTTLGFHEHIGFRAGISTPFYPYNMDKDKAYNILEIPLIIMDTTLFSPLKMNLTYKEAKKRCLKIIDTTKKVNGQVSLLWHNNSFDKFEYKWLGKLYWQIINYICRP